MKTSHETNDEIWKDFSMIRLDAKSFEELTVDKAKKTYHKRAAEIHPDKADPGNQKQVADLTLETLTNFEIHC